MSDAFGFVVFLVVVDLVVIGSVVGTTWAGATGRLTANPTMGLRTPATVASREAWLAGHRAAWPRAVVMAAIALLCMVAALWLAWVGYGTPAWAIALLPVPIALVGLMALTRAAHRGALDARPTR